MNSDKKSIRPKNTKLSKVRSKWLFRLGAICFSIFFVFSIDIFLTIFQLLPPDDPTLFYYKTHANKFSPFIETNNGFFTIRPDWIKDEDIVVGTKGMLPWRHFINPGFRSCLIKRRKSKNEFRIFALGGSTTYGFGVGAKGAFPALLERRLKVLYKELEVKVFNLGCPGFASDRVANLLVNIMDLEPDLIIVYSGHNELIQGHVQNDLGSNFSTKIHRSILEHSSIARWMKHILLQLRSPKDDVYSKELFFHLKAGNIPIFDPKNLPLRHRSFPSENFLNKIALNYSLNIKEMATFCQEKEIPILFVLPIVNLRRSPIISVHNKDFRKSKYFETLLQKIKDSILEGKYKEAFQDANVAVNLSPRYAMIRYLRGEVLLKLGNKEEALIDFQAACDYDLRMNRITTRLESAMVEAVRSVGAKWIDLRPVFFERLGIDSTKTLLYDHCHPTKEGHSLIADTLFPALIELVEMRYH